GMRIYDTAEARAHFSGVGAGPGALRDVQLVDGEALLVAATAGPTDLAACDRDLITSAVVAEGGRPAPALLAQLWWTRLHGGAPTPTVAPTAQLMATPGKLRRVYQAVLGAAQTAGLDVRAHISRFDADGAVLFFTLQREDRVLTLADDDAAI